MCILWSESAVVYQTSSVPPDCSRYRSAQRHTDRVFVAVGVQRLQLAAEGAVLTVQRMLVAVLSGLGHLHRYLDVTQSLGEGR